MYLGYAIGATLLASEIVDQKVAKALTISLLGGLLALGIAAELSSGISLPILGNIRNTPDILDLPGLFFGFVSAACSIEALTKSTMDATPVFEDIKH